MTRCVSRAEKDHSCLAERGADESVVERIASPACPAVVVLLKPTVVGKMGTIDEDASEASQ